MINAFHLFWIVPLSACFGFLIAALLTVASRADEIAGYDE